ncbi:unnamed protein product [Linum trigynum]|uniref:Uncharacterized protein n=1 Tax=Linum trigynum TaxID=586398 RepID=A0AAV2ET90_9ROSI
MQAAHLLLGHPWQFDRGVCHYGDTNCYNFKHQGRTFLLKPLSPTKVREDQRPLEASRRRKREEIGGTRAKEPHDVNFVARQFMLTGYKRQKAPRRRSRAGERVNPPESADRSRVSPLAAEHSTRPQKAFPRIRMGRLHLHCWIRFEPKML